MTVYRTVRIIIIIIIILQCIGHSGTVPVQNFNFWTYESIWAVGRIPWTGDQPNARPLPTHDNTNTTEKRGHTSMSWVRFEPITCLRPRGHWDRLFCYYTSIVRYNLFRYLKESYRNFK